MTKQILCVKEFCQHINLFKELGKEASHTTKTLGKDVSWLQFAKRTKHSYRFLCNKKRQWQELEKIAKKVAKKYPSYTTGQIADILATLVNTTVKDMIGLSGVNNSKGLNYQEKNYLETQLISAASKAEYVPRYPWIMPVSKISNRSWRAKDLSSNQHVSVKKLKQGKFYLYHLHY